MLHRFFRLTSDFSGIYAKPGEARTSPGFDVPNRLSICLNESGSDLISEIDVVKRTASGIPFLEIIIGDIQISPFGDFDAGVSENPTQGIDVHTGHQAALGEIIA